MLSAWHTCNQAHRTCSPHTCTLGTGSFSSQHTCRHPCSSSGPCDRCSCHHRCMGYNSGRTLLLLFFVGVYLYMLGSFTFFFGEISYEEYSNWLLWYSRCLDLDRKELSKSGIDRSSNWISATFFYMCFLRGPMRWICCRRGTVFY